MKNLILFVAFCTSIALVGCGGEGGSAANSNAAFQISGNIADAKDLQLYFDKTGFNNVNNVIQKADINSNGDFSIGLEEHPGEGAYRMRIGTKKGFFVFDGTETKIEVKGSLNDFDSSTQQVTGSTSTSNYLAVDQKFKAKQMNIDNFNAQVGSMDGMVSAFLAHNYLRGSINAKTVSTLEKVEAKLKADHPTSAETGNFAGMVREMNGRLEQLSIGQVIPVENRRPAKEISYPSPSGKKYSLSELKGKVVLVDFWASWCRPCRMANPHVVGLYDKYNKDGFEVFSVSLDSSNGKSRWEDAIKKDNLKWKYHVSDLKKWQSVPAKEWGVTGIPKTFLIDREGRIAAVNPNWRNGQLDAALEQLING